MYRTNSPPPPEPIAPIPFREGHPLMYRTGLWLMGAIVSLGVAWLVTVGAFKLGRWWFSVLGVTTNNPSDSPINWLFGLILYAVVPGFYYAARFIGQVIEEKLFE